MAVEFPAFLKLEHRADGSAKSRFIAEVDSTLDAAQKRFSEFSGEARRLMDQAFSSPRRSDGALNLDVSGMRAAARAAQERATAARDVALATQLAAQAEGDYSAKARLAIAATQAAAREAEQAAQAAMSHAQAVEQVQTQLGRFASQTRVVTSEYIDLARAEIGAANGAALLEGIYRGTALALDHQSNSARESASAFEAMFAAQAKTEASASQLRAALDPMFAAQQRFDAELARADQLLEAGAISTREYAAAQQLARDNLRAAAAAATQSNDAIARGARVGTNAQQNVINSTRASRVAFIQLGQQMQDVTIQAQLGTNAFQIFAQQVPQAAFALSGLERSANKTQAAIGRIATFMSGPWGAAIFAATAVLGPLIYKLIESGDEASDAEKKTYDFSRALDVLGLSADKATTAMEQLVEKTRAAIQVQGDFSEAIFANARASVGALEDRLAKLQQRLGELTGGPLDFIPSVAGIDQRAIGKLKEQIAATTEALKLARQAATDAEIASAQSSIIEKLDEGTAAAKEFERAVGELNERLRESRDDPIGAQSTGIFISEEGYKAEFERLSRLKEARIEAIREAKKSQRAADEASLGDMTALIQQLFPGARVTSGYRPGDKGDHGARRAIDFVPAGGMGQYTTDEVRQILEQAGVDIRRNARGTEQLFGPGRPAARPGDHDDHFHVAWQGGAPDPKRVADAVRRAEELLKQFGERAGESIARINERFDEQPRLIDQAARATRELDATIAELSERKPPGFEDLIAQAEAAKATIEDALVRPFRELREESERRAEIDLLILSGRGEEAAVLQEIWRIENQIGDLNEQQRAEVEGIVRAEWEHVEALQRAQEIQSAYLDTTRGVRGELEAIFAGEGDLGNFKKLFQRLQSKVLVEQIFGDVLRDLDKYVKENTGIEDSVDHLTEETLRAGDAALNFADTINLASQRIAAGGTGSLESEFDAFFGTGSASQPATGAPANDNEIVVTASRNSVNGLTPERYFEHMSRRIVEPMLAGMDEIFGTKFFGQLSGALSGALYGYSTGGAVGGVLGGLKGLVDDAFGGAGGALSNALGKGLAGAQAGTMVAGLGDLFGLKMSNTGAQIGGAIGSFLPIPGGQIIGAVAGGLIGKLFGGNKTANAVLTGGGTSIGGKDKGNYGVASGLGGSVQDALARIAEQLDAEIGNFFVTIGTRGDEFRVNTGGTSLKLKNGAKGFGQDEAAAIAFALADAIADGAIKGLKASEARLLQTGKDVDEQIRKILDFRSVFTRLRAYKDPVGAALDDLNEEFDRLKDIFTEAGASAAEFAQLEELYGIERANAIKEASERFTGSLRELLDEMNMGDMGLSLRDRRASAQTRYDELADRVRAGDATAFDDFAEAARTLLGIERELSGSTNAYFELFNEVRGLTQSALDQQTAAIEAATGRDSPFSDSTGGAANDNQGVIDGLGNLGDRLIDALGGRLDAVNRNIGALLSGSQTTQDLPLQPYPYQNYYY